jgi:hypothetical protein
LRGAIADQRHTVLDVWKADTDTGAELNLPCCPVFRFRDGRADDYLIYMAVNPVFAPSGPCSTAAVTTARACHGAGRHEGARRFPEVVQITWLPGIADPASHL